MASDTVEEEWGICSQSPPISPTDKSNMPIPPQGKCNLKKGWIFIEKESQQDRNNKLSLTFFFFLNFKFQIFGKTLFTLSFFDTKVQQPKKFRLARFTFKLEAFLLVNAKTTKFKEDFFNT